jgi:hypothetical protein
VIQKTTPRMSPTTKISHVRAVMARTLRRAPRRR